MSAIKVCMLTYAMPPEHSGAAKQAITLASKLALNGVEIFFVTQGNKAENLRNQNVAGFRVIRIYKETLFWKILAPLRFFFALIKERRNFDIIHVHGVGYIAKIAVAYGLLFRKKVILKMTMFGEDDAMTLKNGRYGLINFWFFSQASHYVAMTSGFYNSCVEAQIPISKISLIPNGVDTDKFKPLSKGQKLSLRKKLNLPSEKWILVYAGMIRPEKGIDFLLDIIDNASKLRRDMMLLLLGPVEIWLPEAEKIYVKQVLERVQSLSTKECVFFAGNVGNVNEYFQTSDIFVSASYREGFPNVLIEAMSCGLPPIVVSIPDVYDKILMNRLEGIIVKERDAVKFLEEIIHLNDDNKLYETIASAARKKAEEDYSIGSVAKSYLELYTHLV